MVTPLPQVTLERFVVVFVSSAEGIYIVGMSHWIHILLMLQRDSRNLTFDAKNRINLERERERDGDGKQMGSSRKRLDE